MKQFYKTGGSLIRPPVGRMWSLHELSSGPFISFSLLSSKEEAPESQTLSTMIGGHSQCEAGGEPVSRRSEPAVPDWSSAAEDAHAGSDGTQSSLDQRKHRSRLPGVSLTGLRTDVLSCECVCVFECVRLVYIKTILLPGPKQAGRQSARAGG